MDKDTARAINALSNKINAIDQKLDAYFNHRCDKSDENISVNGGGITEIGDIVSTHDGAIEELAMMVANLAEGGTVQ